MTSPAERLQACLAFTLAREGGYQNRTDDAGNWWGQRLIGTNRGISAPTLAAWFGPQRAATLSADDMRDLSEADARAIYAARYWNAVRGDELPAGVDLMLFDFAVLAGPAASVRVAQAQLARILGTVTVDGFLGPRTLGAIQRLSPRAFIPPLAEGQAGYLSRLAASPDNPGWAVRGRARQKAATRMLEHA